MNTKKWFHSPCYWNVWAASFLYWFIFYHLCTNHYCTSLTIFFSPFNVCFLLLITHIHNFTMCTSHSDFSTNCCIWSWFFISSTHHNQCTSVISQFVVNDNSFILSLFCYYWLSFHSHGSYLHRIFTLFL